MRSVAAAFLSVFLLIGGTVPARGAYDKPQINWLREFERARNEAQSLDRPLLLFFTAKWCPACLRVERTVFVDKRVIEFISERYVAVHVDADAAPELVEAWNVDRLPTALIISSAGTVLGKIEGFRPADKYLSELRTLATTSPDRSLVKDRSSRPSTATNAANSTSSERQRVELAATDDRNTRGSNAEISLTLQEDPDLALGGVCPVTMVDGRKIVTGDPEFSACYDGATYWFAGAAELERFRASPGRYAPVDRGLCRVSLVDNESEVQGSMHCAALYRDRLYFFVGLEQRRRFQANPRRYVEDRRGRISGAFDAEKKLHSSDSTAQASTSR
jgi:YHS domain-containing protein/thioredoxin-related protein